MLSFGVLTIVILSFVVKSFDEVVQLADDCFASTRHAGVPSVAAIQKVATGAVSLPGPAVLDEGFSQQWQSQQQVAAVAFNQNRGQGRGRGWRGRGRGGNRGNRGGGGGSQSTSGSGGSDSSQTHPRHKGPRHSDLPPFSVCQRHWSFGKSAHFCMEPATCPWKDHWIPKPNQ